MLENALHLIERLIVTYGAVGVFVGAVFEEILSIIPSAAIIMFSGFFLMGGSSITIASIFKFILLVGLPVALGLTIGSLFVYGVVYYVGEPVIHRFGKWFGISWRDIEKFQNYLTKDGHNIGILFTARAIPVIPFSVINALCGLVRWPLKSYIPITFFGAFVRGSAIGFIGWQLGSFYKEHAKLFSQLESYLGYVLVIFIIGFVSYRFLRKRGYLK
jgi:membrane protein DedA with SNARE-associated domain